MMRQWEVDFDFVKGYKVEYPTSIKQGFATESEAQKWAQENTTDGKVLWYETIEEDEK